MNRASMMHQSPRTGERKGRILRQRPRRLACRPRPRRGSDSLGGTHPGLRTCDRVRPLRPSDRSAPHHLQRPSKPQAGGGAEGEKAGQQRYVRPDEPRQRHLILPGTESQTLQRSCLLELGLLHVLRPGAHLALGDAATGSAVPEWRVILAQGRSWASALWRLDRRRACSASGPDGQSGSVEIKGYDRPGGDRRP